MAPGIADGIIVWASVFSTTENEYSTSLWRSLVARSEDERPSLDAKSTCAIIICRRMFVLRKKAAIVCEGSLQRAKKAPKHLHLFRKTALCVGCEGSRALSHSIRGINVFKALQHV